MTNYYLTEIAEQDIDDIVSYIAVENKNAALKLLDSLFKSLAMLAENPMMGHERPDLTNKPVRFWPFKAHYLIVYSYDFPIKVVRVLSGYRDISSLLV
ncbi:MAG: plasmid stabilization system family protein [Legionellales bacterium]|nr:plasmid stabilization system family protein [Legionellales bacterium]